LRRRSRRRGPLVGSLVRVRTVRSPPSAVSSDLTARYAPGHIAASRLQVSSVPIGRSGRARRGREKWTSVVQLLCRRWWATIVVLQARYHYS
jgi:hypothetical protein